jgi:hypothetical protein
MDGHVARMEYIRNTYKSLFGKSGRMGALGRHMHRWEDNIKMNLGQ